MGLTVLNVAYPLAPVGPDAVGGAEQVLTWLDAALVRAGFRSIVVACEGSATAGALVATPRIEGPLTEAARRAAAERHRIAILRALEAGPVDVVHMHGFDFHRYLPPPGVPVLATLHLPPAWYPPEALRPARPGTFLNCVSASQRRACPPDAALLAEVPNGVPIDRLRTQVGKRRFSLALGRICPEKGFHLALDAARRARLPLLLGGEVFRYDVHERYFREEIVPRLGAERRFLGPVSLRRKRRLLTAARCVVVPSLVEETSSLVAMEALACGTPVVACSRGALPEIVEHGRTGFLVNDVQEMAEAMLAAPALQAEACREAARERFSAERMAARYIELYRTLTRGSPAGGREGRGGGGA